MIRHQVYFDTLGSMKEDSASWRSVFAGLSVLRLVDAYADAGSPANQADWAQLHNVRAAIEAVGEGNPVRGVLTSVFEQATKRSAIDDTVCTALMAYGRALDYEASWSLATDVFSTVAKLARPERNARLAVEAHTAAMAIGTFQRERTRKPPISPIPLAIVRACWGSRSVSRIRTWRRETCRKQKPFLTT